MSVEVRLPVWPTVSPASLTFSVSVVPVWPSTTRCPSMPESSPRSEETLIVSDPGPARIVVTAWRYVLTIVERVAALPELDVDRLEARVADARGAEAGEARRAEPAAAGERGRRGR